VTAGRAAGATGHDDDAGDPERTALLGILTLLAGVGVVVLVLVHGHLLVPAWVIAAVAVPWAGFALWLRVNRRGLGREGRYVDWWSIPHTFAGIVLGMVGIEGAVVTALAVGWELIEIGTRVREHPANRVIDVVLAVAGWTAITLVLGGAIPFV